MYENYRKVQNIRVCVCVCVCVCARAPGGGEGGGQGTRASTTAAVTADSITPVTSVVKFSNNPQSIRQNTKTRNHQNKAPDR